MTWHILTKIAAGSFGTVYRVQHEQTGQIAALKIIHPAQRHQQRRIKGAFLSAQKIQQENCVRMIEWYELAGDFGFVMEFIDSRPISVLRQANLNAIIRAIVQVCNGLDAIHTAGLIHRDLKPENILITQISTQIPGISQTPQIPGISETDSTLSNQADAGDFSTRTDAGNFSGDFLVKITDFDLARFDAGSLLTETGVFMGTFQYASPEQFERPRQLDPRSDLYSLGVILYELVTGQRPFDGHDVREIMFHHLRSQPAPPRRIAPYLPEAVETVILRLLQKEPRDRYPNAREVAAALQQTLSDSQTVIIQATGNYLLPPRFVDRREPLKILQQAFARSDEFIRHSQQATNEFVTTNLVAPNIIFIAGESGLGKSKLWAEFADGCKHSARIFQTVCRNQGAAYEPLRDIVLQAVAALGDLSDAQKAECAGFCAWDLVKIAPTLAAEPFMSRIEKLPELSDPKAAEIRLFDAVTTLIKNLSKFIIPNSSFLIFFDDLHWADEQICKWLAYAARNLKNLPVLIVGAYRDTDMTGTPLARALPELRRDGRLTEIALAPLPMEDVSDLLVSMMGKSDPLESRFAAEIFKQTNGNPNFIHAVMNHLLESGQLRRLEGRWDLDIETFSEFILPDSIRQVIGERLDRLSEPVRRTLQAAAVIGKSFDLDLLIGIMSPQTSRALETANVKMSPALETAQKLEAAQILKVPGTLSADLDSVLDALANARAAKLIDELDDTGEHYQFTHDAIRETLERETHPRRRKSRHRAAGEYLELRHAADLDAVTPDLARHFDAAGVTDKAITYSLKAADLAKKDYANEQAIYWYDRAIALLPDTDERKVDAIFDKLRILNRIGSWDEYERLCQDVQVMCQANGDQKRYAIGLRLLGEIYWRKGDYVKAIDYTTKSLELHKQLSDDSSCLKALANISAIYYDSSNLEQAMEFSEKALNLSEQLNDDQIYSDVIGNRGNIYGDTQNYKMALECYQRRLTMATALNDALGVAAAINNIGTIYEAQGDYKEALRYFEQALEHGKKIGNLLLISKSYSNIGIVCSHLGNIQRAYECYCQQLTISKATGNKDGYAFSMNNLGALCYEKGDYSGAEKFFLDYLAISQEIGSLRHLSMAHNNLGAVYMEESSYDKAIYHCTEGLNLAKKKDHKVEISEALGTLGSIHALKGEFDKAVDYTKQSLMLNQETGNRRGLIGDFGWLAEIAKMKNEFQQAAVYYDQAIEVARNIGLKYKLSEFLVGKADLVLTQGNIALADTLNQESFEIATEIERSEIIFKSELLSAKIDFANHRHLSGVEKMVGMLSKESQELRMVDLHYELWKMKTSPDLTDLQLAAGAEEHRQQALALYQTLYAKTPKYAYKQRIMELSKISGE